jgi:hypothetical protein
MRIQHSLPFVFVITVTPACISIVGPDFQPFQKDAAIQLSECMDAAIKAAPATQPTVFASCRLTSATTAFQVILLPDGEVTDAQLLAGGVPESLLEEVRALRYGSTRAEICVIATGPGVTGIGVKRTVKSSFTTSQSFFVKIDHLMVLAKNDAPVEVTIAGPGGARVIEKIE